MSLKLSYRSLALVCYTFLKKIDFITYLSSDIMMTLWRQHGITTSWRHDVIIHDVKTSTWPYDVTRTLCRHHNAMTSSWRHNEFVRSSWRHDVIVTSLWRHCDVIVTSSCHDVMIFLYFRLWLPPPHHPLPLHYPLIELLSRDKIYPETVLNLSYCNGYFSGSIWAHEWHRVSLLNIKPYSEGSILRCVCV